MKSSCWHCPVGCFVDSNRFLASLQLLQTHYSHLVIAELPTGRNSVGNSEIERWVVQCHIPFSAVMGAVILYVLGSLAVLVSEQVYRSSPI